MHLSPGLLNKELGPVALAMIRGIINVTGGAVSLSQQRRRFLTGPWASLSGLRSLTGRKSIHKIVRPVRSQSACEQFIQLRELFGQAFRRAGESFVEGRFGGVEFV